MPEFEVEIFETVTRSTTITIEAPDARRAKRIAETRIDNHDYSSQGTYWEWNFERIEDTWVGDIEEIRYK